MPQPTTLLTHHPRADHPSDRAGGTDRMAEALERAAVSRLEDRAGLRAQVMTYVLVNTMLVGFWAISGGGDFWPFFPLALWGAGLTLHALGVWSAAPTDAEVRSGVLRMTR